MKTVGWNGCVTWVTFCEGEKDEVKTSSWSNINTILCRGGISHSKPGSLGPLWSEKVVDQTDNGSLQAGSFWCFSLCLPISHPPPSILSTIHLKLPAGANNRLVVLSWVESGVCKYSFLTPVGNFLVADKGGSQWEEEENRSAVGTATRPSCAWF